VTPIVRKLANDNGIDLSNLSGTGVGGRIRKEDVIAATSAPSAAAPTAPYTPAASSAPKATVTTSHLRGTTEPMSRLRKVLAERAVASMVSTAQLTTVVEVDVTAIASMRQNVQDAFVSKTGVKLNFMPFFALAAAEALRSHPKLNASVDGENIVYHPTENISFAVDTEKGLLTPVIRDASTLNLAQIALQIADLAARTRNNQLKPDELSGGTFTLTNTGSRGALFDTPVVFLPQVAILGTGIVTKRPAVVKTADGTESIAIRSMVYLALSYDHRVVDGADASRFLVDVKQRLEEANFSADLGI
jgi:2-oxoglutarate dehydrogenase E2 component (dihydrolipoamide succinyltransferase)